MQFTFPFQETPKSFHPYFMSFPESEPEAIVDERLPLNTDFRDNRPHLKLATPYGEIDYVRVGRAGAPVILLVPGVPDQLYTFHRMIQVLAVHFDVVAVSPPGKGFSSYSDTFDFSLTHYAEFWRHFIQTLHLTTVTVVAYSSGLSEILQGVLQFGAREMAITRIVSLCGWAPQVLPEALRLSLVDKVLGSSEGPKFFRLFHRNKALGLEASFLKTFYSLKNRNELSQLSAEYMKAWPHQPRDGQSPEQDERKLRGICSTVRFQNQICGSIKSFYRESQTMHDRLDGMALLVIAGTHDRVVRGPNDDHFAKRAGRVCRFADAQGWTYADRLFNEWHRLSGYHPENRLFHLQDGGHMLPLEAPVRIAQAIVSTASTQF